LTTFRAVADGRAGRTAYAVADRGSGRVRRGRGADRSWQRGLSTDVWRPFPGRPRLSGRGRVLASAVQVVSDCEHGSDVSHMQQHQPDAQGLPRPDRLLASIRPISTGSFLSRSTTCRFERASCVWSRLATDSRRACVGPGTMSWDRLWARRQLC
jgi:hypothetical protein